MFNPTNLDEVCVQDTNIESKRKNIADIFSKNPLKLGWNTFKGKGKGKKTYMVKKGGEKPTCMHCQENGHDASKL